MATFFVNFNRAYQDGEIFFKELSIIGNYLSRETFLNFCLKKEEGTEFFSLKAIQHFGTVYFPHTKRSQTRTNN